MNIENNLKLWEEPIIFTPSLICLDMLNLQTQIDILKANAIELLHIDILDGHFSPSMPLGLETVRQLRRYTDLNFDCHVMTTANNYFIDELLDIGVQQITFHIETESHIDGMLNRIKARGVRAGVALKPATSLTVLDYCIEKCDTVLLMLINPGYAFLPNENQVKYASTKIDELYKKIQQVGSFTKIAVDGRISKNNIKDFAEQSVQQFVIGSTSLVKNDLAGSLQELNSLKLSILGG